jgi:hypothetical protein
MSHSHEPPGLPTVVDEAGDTPNWVPLLGLLLAVGLALLIAARQAFGFGAHEEAPAVGADAGVAAEGAAAAKPADAKPAE